MVVSKRNNLLPLKKEQIKAASIVCARAFKDDPWTSYIFSGDDKWENKMRYMLEFYLRLEMRLGEVYTVSPKLEGVAGWLPSGRKIGLIDLQDELDIIVPPETAGSLEPEDIPVDIVYEDDDLILVNKPAGMTTHPAPGHPNHTLLNAILCHFPNLPQVDDRLRPGIVHRLDKDTSGLLLIAKNRHALADLSQQFKDRSVTKVYLVLVKGRLKPESGAIEAPIGRDPANRKKMAIVSSGREAHTEYRVIKYLNGYTLLEVTLKTGRTHQIRVHLAAIGFPVVGDSTYGVKSPHLKRQFVHAHKLKFALPSSGEYREFTTELPDDLKKALNSFV